MPSRSALGLLASASRTFALLRGRIAGSTRGWRWRRRSADALALEPIHHLLIVAGPHGSGKSTFLNLLAADSLPDDIKALMPPGAAGWVQTSLMKVFKPGEADAAAGGARARGLALHYNILRPHVRNLADYASDPSLRLIGLAEAVTVVTLRPPLPRLVSQFAARSAVQQAAAPWRTRARRAVVDRLYSLGRTLLPPPVQRILSIPSEHTHDLSGRFGRVVRLYHKPGWLEARYASWHAYLAATAAAGKKLRSLEVEPVETEATGPSFRLLGKARS